VAFSYIAGSVRISRFSQFEHLETMQLDKLDKLSPRNTYVLCPNIMSLICRQLKNCFAN
jgi:hypothetical protein